jgi:hypothetical protein
MVYDVRDLRRFIRKKEPKHRVHGRLTTFYRQKRDNPGIIIIKLGVEYGDKIDFFNFNGFF